MIGKNKTKENYELYKTLIANGLVFDTIRI